MVRRFTKGRSISRLLWLWFSFLLLLAACDAAGTRAAPDDSAVHQDIAQGRSGAEVTFDASLLAEPTQVGGHEHLLVSDPAGDQLEVDHNTSLAASVPAHQGDRVVVHGQLYIDPGPLVGVHCTHAHTSSGCPMPGWIQFKGAYYE